MSKMTLILDSKGLSSIISDFDLLFIDIWGVIHNGIKLNGDSVEVLNKLDEIKKEYILLTNAPRPNSKVISFLTNMGLDEKKCQKVYTSGEASINYLTTDWKNLKFFHIGPPRDFDLFKLFKKNKVEKIDNANFFLCTGLFDSQSENLEFYKKMLLPYIKKRMICTNPDLIVDRGKKREFCAGMIAKIFEDIGGRVDYFGKPYPLVYNQSTNTKNKKILCIGDNLNTDIKGANIQNYSSLFISGGIHKNENEGNLENLLKNYNVSADFSQTKLKW